MKQENIVIVIVVILVALVMLYNTSSNTRREKFSSNDSILDFLDRMIKNQTRLNEYEEDETRQSKKIDEIGIRPKGQKKWKVSDKLAIELSTRRTKVEPVIGHIKGRGLRKSKMKSDESTKQEGQRSILSFNMSKLGKDLCGNKFKWTG